MTELENLHRRIFSDDEDVRDGVTAEEIGRYLQLQEEQTAREAERRAILAELRQQKRASENQGEPANIRGVQRIARGLRGGR